MDQTLWYEGYPPSEFVLVQFERVIRSVTSTIRTVLPLTDPVQDILRGRSDIQVVDRIVFPGWNDDWSAAIQFLSQLETSGLSVSACHADDDQPFPHLIFGDGIGIRLDDPNYRSGWRVLLRYDPGRFIDLWRQDFERTVRMVRYMRTLRHSGGYPPSRVCLSVPITDQVAIPITFWTLQSEPSIELAREALRIAVSPRLFREFEPCYPAMSVARVLARIGIARPKATPMDMIDIIKADIDYLVGPCNAIYDGWGGIQPLKPYMLSGWRLFDYLCHTVGYREVESCSRQSRPH